LFGEEDLVWISFNIVASLGQVTEAKLTFQTIASGFASDLYMFGVAREMVVSIVATHVQTIAKLVAPPLDVTKDSGCVQHSGLLDHIGQVHLPLSFGLVDATSTIHFHVPVAIVPHRGTIVNDLAYTLAYKVLQMLVFSLIEMLASNFALA